MFSNPYTQLFTDLQLKYRGQPVTPDLFDRLQADLAGPLQATYPILKDLDAMAQTHLALQIYQSLEAQSTPTRPVPMDLAEQLEVTPPPSPPPAPAPSPDRPHLFDPWFGRYCNLPAPIAPALDWLDRWGAVALYSIGKLLQLPMGNYAQLWPVFLGLPFKILLFLVVGLLLCLQGLLLFLLCCGCGKPGAPNPFAQTGYGVKLLGDVVRCGWMDNRLAGLDRAVIAKYQRLDLSRQSRTAKKKRIEALEADYQALQSERDRYKTQVESLRRRVGKRAVNPNLFGRMDS
ncbi:MAG: bZIP transcription factor [Prochlorothrix sp.]